MSRLVLLRHGQARAFEEDSDRLSVTGAEQIELLRNWWASHGVVFTEVITGTLERHRQTREALQLTVTAEDPRWNEYDAQGLLRWAANDSAFAQPMAEFEAHRGTPLANRYFQRVFERLLQRWIEGRAGDANVETWEAFRERVAAALREILDAGGENRNVLVITSGGPIGVVAQTVMAAPPRMALELNWRLKNASLTEFLFTRARISMDSFNSTPHLSEVTYR